MDRSVDSIGSCSLDVDADSSDVSGIYLHYTSGSLNFATPLSAKDITKEFTAKITERCQESQRTATYLDPYTDQVHTLISSPKQIASSPEKKPSYLNLACCVNGYSNLTTYDSKIRQHINKSREVSPIRPSTNGIQYCKKNNSLTTPIFVSTHNTVKNIEQNMTSNQYLNDSTESNDNVNTTGVIDTQYSPQQSFIQQRVERLYGPGALAQVFYNPNKAKSKNLNNTVFKETSLKPQTEFCRKHQQVYLKKYSNNCNKDSNGLHNIQSNTITGTDVTDHSINNTIDLPVLRHLSQEFRAQLPSISPKRSYLASTHSNISIAEVESNLVNAELNNNLNSKNCNNGGDSASKALTETSEKSVKFVTSDCDDDLSSKERNGNYFLEILKHEQSRLLQLANQAEKYSSMLINNSNVSEEVFGLLRSAAGKARLLVSQKMKQFEGLCYNNLNRSPEDAFPTTTEDLQGFWDMVYLQVAHIDSIFKEIEDLRLNDWKFKPTEEKALIAPSPKPQKALSVGKTTRCKQKTIEPKLYNGNSSTNNAALKREIQRKQFLELKRKNKLAINTDTTQINAASAIELFVSDNTS